MYKLLGAGKYTNYCIIDMIDRLVGSFSKREGRQRRRIDRERETKKETERERQKERQRERQKRPAERGI